MSASPEWRPADCEFWGGTVRQEYRILTHPEQERSKQKAPCASGEFTDGGQKGSGLSHPTTQEIFAPVGGADSCTKKFKVGRPVPAAPLEIGGTERLRGGASGDDLSLVQN